MEKYMKYNKKFWDLSYKRGLWNYLTSEESRYSEIAKQIHNYVNAEVLDLGCGRCILYEYIKKYIASYDGVDISDVVLSIPHDEKFQVFQSDITMFKSEKKYDVIIFNEVLYYLKDTNAILYKYKQMLKKNGCIICSIYLPDKDVYREMIEELIDTLKCNMKEEIQVKKWYTIDNKKFILFVFKRKVN